MHGFAKRKSCLADLGLGYLNSLEKVQIVDRPIKNWKSSWHYLSGFYKGVWELHHIIFQNG